jgi:glycosyltransferase involved in cell wall biosynthesis
MHRDAPLILMLGASLKYPGGMTEVVRSYAAAGLFDSWPLRYISTYEGRSFSAKLWPWLAALGTVLALLLRRRVALIHVHSAAYGSFWRKSVICTLSLAFRVPYVIHLHDGRLPAFRRDCGLFAMTWLCFILRHAARVVVLTRRWRDEVQAIEPQANISIIGNPVPVPTALAPLSRPARRLLFLAWLHKDKGILDLIAALPHILRRVPEAELVIAGGGSAGGCHTPEQLKQFADALGVEHALRFAGWVDGARKAELLGEADVFVLPSYCEALPVGLLEAMAAGVPAVASRVGGIPDVIEHQVSGLLVEPGEPRALAQAIVAILTDEALRTRLREAAHREVKRYSMDAVLGELESLYRALGVASRELSLAQ